MVSAILSTITLRFLTIDDETKSLIINGGNCPILDLTLKVLYFDEYNYILLC